MSNSMKLLLTILCLMSFLTACAAPSSPPATPSPIPPSATSLPPTPTATQIPPTSTPSPKPLAGFYTLHMVSPSAGWAVTVSTENISRLLKTDDGGRTWSDVTPATLPPGAFVSFFLSENSAWAFAYSDPSRGLAHTVDGGRTWQMLPALPIPVDFTATAVTFQDENTGWFEFVSPGGGSADIGFFITRDGGQTWSQVMLTAPSDHPDLALSAIPGTLHTCMMCRDVIYFDPERVLLVYGDLNAPGTPSNTLTLSISMDTGKAWKNIRLAPPASGVIDENELPFVPTFFDQKNGLLPFGFVKYDAALNIGQTQLILYSTQDGGVTWASVANSFVQNVDVLKSQDVIELVSSQVAFVPCGTDLCSTHDGGQTWQTVKSNLSFVPAAGTEYVQRIDFIDANTGWAVTTNGNDNNLWKTLDGGVSWVRLSPIILP